MTAQESNDAVAAAITTTTTTTSNDGAWIAAAAAAATAWPLPPLRVGPLPRAAASLSAVAARELWALLTPTIARETLCRLARGFPADRQAAAVAVVGLPPPGPNQGGLRTWLCVRLCLDPARGYPMAVPTLGGVPSSWCTVWLFWGGSIPTRWRSSCSPPWWPPICVTLSRVFAPATLWSKDSRTTRGGSVVCCWVSVCVVYFRCAFYKSM